MGWENMFHCEKEPFPQSILKYYWPKAQLYDDITTADFTIWNGRIDILTGGFPCQPYSVAGKRKGKEDERHLWPEMLRAIREIQPRWVVGENVHGLLNWNGGMVFDEVQADLENEGYEVTPFLLPACGVNAPHRRNRIFFIAYSNKIRRNNGSYNWQKRYFSINKRITQKDQSKRKRWERRISKASSINANPNNERLEGSKIVRSLDKIKSIGKQQFTRLFQPTWKNFPTQSPICGGNDGIPTELDGITIPKWRNESIKGYGNAIVPQVALQIFKAIEQYEKHNT